MSTINITPINVGKILTAGKYRVIATLPSMLPSGASQSATVNARVLSHDLTVDVKVRLAICPDSFQDGSTIAPTDDQWIQPVDLKLGPNGLAVGIFEDSAIVLQPGQCIVAYSDTGKATCHVHGLMRSLGA